MEYIQVHTHTRIHFIKNTRHTKRRITLTNTHNHTNKQTNKRTQIQTYTLSYKIHTHNKNTHITHKTHTHTKYRYADTYKIHGLLLYKKLFLSLSHSYLDIFFQSNTLFLQANSLDKRLRDI